MSELASKIKSIRWQQVMLILLMAMMVAGADSCKSSGKLSKKERKAQIEAAKKQLEPIINGTSTLSLDEQKRVVSQIMDKNLNDPVLNDMIIQAQQKLKSLQAEQNQAKAKQIDMARATLFDLLLNKDNKTADQIEQELNAIKRQNLNDPEISELIAKVEQKIKDMRSGGGSLSVKTQLENAFNTIVSSAKSGNLSQADNTIQKTLPLFTSEDAPVLIMISREGPDYDKPTNIKRYLNLLKDTKANRNDIDAIMTDSDGKIKELDLIKK